MTEHVNRRGALRRLLGAATAAVLGLAGAARATTRAGAKQTDRETDCCQPCCPECCRPKTSCC